MEIDIRIMELLASKVCHDLVSPVSAINNGVELIEDIGGGVVEEAMKLIADSGTKASRRLRLFRLAYGRAGSECNLGTKDVRAVAEQYLIDTKITLAWGEELPAVKLAESRGFLKLMLNCIMLGEEALAYGGVITLRDVKETPESAGGCRIEVVGRNATMSEKHREALEGSIALDDLTPRNIQAYVTGRFAAQFGLNLSYDISIPDRLDLLLTLAKEKGCMQDVKVS